MRKAMLRGMQADLTKISRHMALGQGQLAAFSARAKEGLPASDLVVKEVRDQVTNLFRAKIVTELMLKHVTKILKDPTRTGERKEAILDKLGTTNA